MKLLFFPLLIVTFLSALEPSSAILRDCYNSFDLQNALEEVLPGDDIILHPGNFSGHFQATKDGTTSQPIMIRSADPSNKAVVRGTSPFSYNIASLYVVGNYVTLKDLEVVYGGRGIVFDDAIGGKILNCKIHTTGEAGVHIQNGSTEFLIEGNTIYDTGCGEGVASGAGIRIGSDKGVHKQSNPKVSFVTVRNNKIGPDLEAEGIDVQEGTHNILIENNIFDAGGLPQPSSSDSLIDLKGIVCTVRGNTFNHGGVKIRNKGIHVIDRGVARSTYDHVIIDNKFNFNDDSSPMVQTNDDTQNIYVSGNIRGLAGKYYSGPITKDRVPDWYETTQATPRASDPESVALPVVTSVPTPRPTLRPSGVPTPSPTCMPTITLPVPSPTSSIVLATSYNIYANWKIQTDYWTDDSINGVFYGSFNDGGSHRSTYYAQLDPGGQIRFTPKIADLTEQKALQLAVRSLSGSAEIQIKVNTVSLEVVAENEWHDHVLNCSYSSLGSEVKIVTLENTGYREITLLLDDIGFVA